MSKILNLNDWFCIIWGEGPNISQSLKQASSLIRFGHLAARDGLSCFSEDKETTDLLLTFVVTINNNNKSG